MQREIPFGSIGFTLHDEQGQVEVQGQMTKHKGLVGKLSVDKGQSFKFDHATNRGAWYHDQLQTEPRWPPFPDFPGSKDGTRRNKLFTIIAFLL